MGEARAFPNGQVVCSNREHTNRDIRSGRVPLLRGTTCGWRVAAGADIDPPKRWAQHVERSA